MDTLITLLPFDTIKNLLINNKFISKFIDNIITNNHPLTQTHIEASHSIHYAYKISSIGIMKFISPFLQKTQSDLKNRSSGYNVWRIFVAYLLGACSNNNLKLVNDLLHFCKSNGVGDFVIKPRCLKKLIRTCFNRCICNGNIEIIKQLNTFCNVHPLVDHNMFANICRQGDLNIIKSVTGYIMRSDIHYARLIGDCVGYAQNIETAEFLIELGIVDIREFTDIFWGSNPVSRENFGDYMGIRIWRILIERAKLNPKSTVENESSPNGNSALIRYSDIDFFCSLSIAHDCKLIKVVSILLTKIFANHPKPIEYINSCANMDELFKDVCVSGDIPLIIMILEADLSDLNRKLFIVKSIGNEQMIINLFRTACISKNHILIKLILEADQSNLNIKLSIAQVNLVYDELFENICISGNCSLIKSVLKEDHSNFDKKLYIIKSIDNNEQLLDILFENMCTFGNSSLISLMLDADSNNIDKILSIAKSIGGDRLLDDLFKNACISKNNFLLKSMLQMDRNSFMRRLSIANKKFVAFLNNIVQLN